MSMRTKVVMILVGDGIKQSTLLSDINTEIQRNESKGWYLRGTPEYVEEARSMMLTFETPATGDYKTEQREPDVPPPPKELFEHK